MSHYDESPVNPLPLSVMLLALLIVLPELAFQAGENGLIGGPAAIGWRADAVERFAFFPDVLSQMVDRNLWPPEHLMRIVTHPFVHPSFMSVVFALVFTLALGKMVGEAMSEWAVPAVFLGSSILASLLYWLIFNDPFPVFGGLPGAYGLIGAYTFLLWLRQVAAGGPQRQAFTLIALLMGIHVVFALIYGSTTGVAPRILGFFAGFGLSFLVVPGGVGRLMEFLRARR
ncbi:GlpG protein (membrane protein of glp regulon) [Candidatus Rhodobacter oscarellae]|uniref:GlpG protein (Membrane protein of glp regulon) n=1 Tax=Candidatus Rhodobacter oscarellae TaxID=1675527 RepID=A0A0J9E9G8_9RHOB|nr:rhomboid family intramembrane serine protease [Candidatus Rhodobacter lobularis]KMW59430.1 GlpG protein (membrane protein of glp regulon) [Candidatus Rhodobacter lobularis]